MIHFLTAIPLLARTDTQNLAVLTGWVVPLGIVAIVYYYAHRRNKLMHDSLQKIIDSGQQVTPEIIAALRSRGRLYSPWNANPSQTPGSTSKPASNDPFSMIYGSRARRDFRSAIFLLAIGAGVVMVGFKLGWIVFFVGLAYLLLVLFERNECLSSPQPPAPSNPPPAPIVPPPPQPVTPAPQPPPTADQPQ